MKTDDLISMLAQEDTVTKSPPSLMPMLFLAGSILLFGLLLATSLFQESVGIRTDYHEAIGSIFVMIKQIAPLLLLVFLLPFMKKTIYPETKITHKSLLLTLPFIVLMGSVFTISLSQQPMANWAHAMQGETLFKCLTFIPLLSLIVIIAEFIWLRQGAPSHPVMAGFYAGLVAGGMACYIYAFHCIEDDPAFYALWYSAGIFIASMIGAIGGKLFLRW